MSHVVTLRLPISVGQSADDLIVEHRAWCLTSEINLRAQPTITAKLEASAELGHVRVTHVHVHFAFEHIGDAVAFKLRWIG